MSDDIRGLFCLKCCPKCGGAMFRECDLQGCDVECLQCGYIMPRARLEALIGPERAAMILDLTRKHKESEQEQKRKRRKRKPAQ